MRNLTNNVMTTRQSKTLSKPQQKVLSALSSANPEKGILTHDLACQTPFTVTDPRLRLQQLERRGLVVSAPWQLRQIRRSLTAEGVAAVKALKEGRAA